MSLLSVTSDVCATVGVLIPTSVFSNLTNNRTMQEMLSLANEMAQRIAYDTRDWTQLKNTQVFNGDGVTMKFPLPADYKRMLLTSNVWRSTSAFHPLRFIPNLDEWNQRRAMNRIDAWGEWTKVNNQIWIWPIMGPGVTASFPYVQKNCVNLTSGGAGDSFQNDTDTFVLPERLLKLAMIWQWKAQKGSPYGEDLGTYTDALDYEAAHDSPSPIIVGRKPTSLSARIAYPWPVPYP